MSQIVTRTPAAHDVPFDQTRVFRFLKSRRDSTLASELSKRIPDLYHQSLKQFNPRYRYRLIGIEQVSAGDSHTVTLSDETEFIGFGIYRLLSKSQKAAVYILSVGDEIEDEIHTRMVRDPYEGFCLEAIASALAYGLFQEVRSDIDREAGDSGTKVLYRYCPGYAYWAIEEQEKIFRLLRPGDIGIELTETYFITPVHSMSGVFGIAEPDPES